MKKKWEMKKLGDVCTVIAGQSPEGRFYNESGDGLPFYQGKKEFGERYIGKPTTWTSKITKEAVKGDILMSVRAPVGPINFATEKICIGRGLAAIRAGKNIIPDYLFYCLSSMQETISGREGAVFASINKSEIENLEIPLPPLDEQQRIVAILDKAFSAIATAKGYAERNLQNSKELFQSYLQNVFADKGEGWEEKKLGEVANTWGRIGWKGLTAKEYTSEGPLFLSVHSLNYGDYVDFRDAFHISRDRYNESPEIMLQEEDILICKDGAGIGKLGIVPKLPDLATINSSLLLIRCKKDIITKYLYYNLLSPFFQSIVKSRLMGATTPHLYQRDIVTFPILLPSLIEQKCIAAKLDALSEQTKNLETIYRRKIADLEELKKSILQKAFDGDL